MKTFIITLTHNQDSVRSAQQAINSAKAVGYADEIEIFDAVTPEVWRDFLPFQHTFYNSPLPDNHYQRSRPDNVGACFASHYLLWKKCVELAEPILILEHDAVFVDNIPNIDFNMCVNFGRPSYIRPREMIYHEPKQGLHPLQQPNFFGHHAYALKPQAAEIFCQDVTTRILTPNDIWMNKETYPWLEDYRPHPVWADTDFSTIQQEPLVPIRYDINTQQEVQDIPNVALPYRIEPHTPQHKYLMKHYPQCLIAPQSKRFIKVTKDAMS